MELDCDQGKLRFVYGVLVCALAESNKCQWVRRESSEKQAEWSEPFGTVARAERKLSKVHSSHIKNISDVDRTY